MKLIDLLAPDRVVLGTAGETVHDVARSLVHAVIASGQVQDADRLEALLAETLPGEAVTVGQRAFLLHFRTDAVERVTGALAVAAVPVHRAHDASKEARVVTLLLAPPGEGTAYLRALAAFARALSREEVVAALEHAGSAEELLAAPELAAVEVPDELLVRDILSGRVVSVTPETSLLQAARLMLRNGVAALPVVSEEQEVLGLISHGEILRHLLARSADRGTSGEHQAATRGGARPSLTAAREHAVRDVMDRSVLCLSEEQSVIEAATLMVNKKLERVPVVREGALIGLLTREDLVRRLFGP